MNPYQLTAGHLLHDRYSILKTLGQGGFGITYLALDNKLHQEVCIKELFISGSSTRGTNMTVQSQGGSDFSFSEFVDRFIQEARQLAKFQHPNIVRVMDIFEENDTAYSVMEFVKGETLKEKIQREGALEEKDSKALINQLLDAVSMVHDKGMLHRDIKPDNILITPEGRVVLIDFGSAREFAEGKTSNQTAMVTPGYAPPEQYSERAKRGPFTDIYALGATLYFLMTGEKPIASTDRSFEELTPPQQLNPKVSNQLSSTILKAMELRPDQRYQKVAEVKEAINSASGMEAPKVSKAKASPKAKVDPEKTAIASESPTTVIQEKPSNPTVIQEKTPTSPPPPTTPPPYNPYLYKPKSNNTWIIVVVIVGFIFVVGAITTAVVLFSSAYDDSSYTYPDYSDSYDDTEECLDCYEETDPYMAEFDCGDGTTINSDYVNDGECDCYSCEDEAELWRCGSGETIPVSYLYDEDCDCSDCSDE